MNIYAGNLPHEVTKEFLQEAFEEYGHVSSINLVKDRYSGQFKGFGFIEMPSQDEAKAAIEGLNGAEINGRTIRVNEALPRDKEGHGKHNGNSGRNNNNQRGGYGKRW
jgi:RNA recognition motif-containing protein